jgi:hypothetical protein
MEAGIEMVKDLYTAQYIQRLHDGNTEVYVDSDDEIDVTQLTSFDSMWNRIETKWNEMENWDDTTLMGNLIAIQSILIDYEDSRKEGVTSTALQSTREFLATEHLMELTLIETLFYMVFLDGMYSTEHDWRNK